MDLKLGDVSKLLNVSKSTLRRWLAEGKIPAYRLGNQYRFSPMEIEAWVLNQKIGQSPQEEATEKYLIDMDDDEEETLSPGLNQFSLYRALNKGVVLTAPGGASKEEVIREAMKEMGPHLKLDPEVTAELLLAREQLMPTALDRGIAVPHTREIRLEDNIDIVNVLFLEEPIEYGALDGQLTHTLFFLFASDDKRHLHLLAKIAHLANQPETLALLLAQPNKLRLLRSVRTFESTLQQKV
jgi:PTS system nitrogen regulatory IIA component